jgi:hypothetical protein
MVSLLMPHSLSLSPKHNTSGVNPDRRLNSHTVVLPHDLLYLWCEEREQEGRQTWQKLRCCQSATCVVGTGIHGICSQRHARKLHTKQGNKDPNVDSDPLNKIGCCPTICPVINQKPNCRNAESWEAKRDTIIRCRVALCVLSLLAAIAPVDDYLPSGEADISSSSHSTNCSLFISRDWPRKSKVGYFGIPIRGPRRHSYVLSTKDDLQQVIPCPGH